LVLPGVERDQGYSGFNASVHIPLSDGDVPCCAAIEARADISIDEGLDLAEPRTAASTTPTSFRQWSEDTLKPAIETADARASQ
jgi:hypothetical protein